MGITIYGCGHDEAVLFREMAPRFGVLPTITEAPVAAKSGHSRGGAVDLTLYHLATGELAPMGGDHDLMDPISHHGAGGITLVEATNRQYLSSIMEDCGFDRYACEWWHYALNVEPYPDTYLIFPSRSPVPLPRMRWCGG
jgi:D-alanyl-D-alanine dipeptidase